MYMVSFCMLLLLYTEHHRHTVRFIYLNLEKNPVVFTTKTLSLRFKKCKIASTKTECLKK